MKLKSIIFLLISIIFLPVYGFSVQTMTIKNDPGTCWWLGIVNHGHLMPLSPGYSADLAANTYGNQAQPLLLSSTGDAVWCEDAPSIHITDDSITIESPGAIMRHKSGSTLREAYRFASREYFPPSGNCLPGIFFSTPSTTPGLN